MSPIKPHRSLQQTLVPQMESTTSLVASSQKDVAIEKGPQPGARAKRVRDTETTHTSKSYTRKKKPRTTEDSQGTHTVPVQVKEYVTAPSQIQFDVTPTNKESQPHSLTIETLQTHNSHTLSLDVDIFPTPLPDPPSLKLREVRHSYAGDHSLVENLLNH